MGSAVAQVAEVVQSLVNGLHTEVSFSEMANPKWPPMLCMCE